MVKDVLRSEAEMQRLFAGHQDSVMRTGILARKLTFSLDQLRYDIHLRLKVPRIQPSACQGLPMKDLIGATLMVRPDHVNNLLRHELTLISKLKYEPYFLTVRDIVAFAQSRNILCQGRGSAANSVVCYCLGITSVSPEIGTMVFERFVSEARNEPPDIDVDFEHERREEVIQHIYER